MDMSQAHYRELRAYGYPVMRECTARTDDQPVKLLKIKYMSLSTSGILTLKIGYARNIPGRRKYAVLHMQLAI